MPWVVRDSGPRSLWLHCEDKLHISFCVSQRKSWKWNESPPKQHIIKQFNKKCILNVSDNTPSSLHKILHNMSILWSGFRFSFSQLIISLDYNNVCVTLCHPAWAAAVPKCKVANLRRWAKWAPDKSLQALLTVGSKTLNRDVAAARAGSRSHLFSGSPVCGHSGRV